MTREEIKNVVNELNALGKNIFLPGAKEEHITRFEEKLNIKLPQKYKDWLAFSDGGEIILPGGIQFYGVESKPLIDLSDNDKPSDDYVVIGRLAMGDPVVFKNGEEGIAIYNHELDKIEDDEMYLDFEAFLRDVKSMLGIGSSDNVK